MSDIPRARQLVEAAKAQIDAASVYLDEALALMTRRSPDFRSYPENPKLTEQQKRQVRTLRSRGYSHARIAAKLNIRNNGRISEAIKGKAHD